MELVPKLLSGDPLLIDFLNSARKNAVSSYSLFLMRVVLCYWSACFFVIQVHTHMYVDLKLARPPLLLDFVKLELMAHYSREVVRL